MDLGFLIGILSTYQMLFLNCLQVGWNVVGEDAQSSTLAQELIRICKSNIALMKALKFVIQFPITGLWLSQ
jgi:hypothetical protein